MKGRKRLDFTDSRYRLRYVFYIHCPGYPRENSLRREIIKYGGKVEGFLSKDVQVLVTNQSCSENRASTPLSPLSTCTSSSRMYTDSPLNSERPSTAIVTRGKALALQAAKMQCNGSSDVMENSRRLGVRVWSLETAVRALKRAKREENRRASRTGVSSTPHGSKGLKTPFIKVEDASHRYKPLSAEFEYWPIMEYLTRLSLDPGFQHGKLVTPSHSPAPPGDHSEQLSATKQPLVALQRMNTNLMERQAHTPVAKSPVRKRVSQKEGKNTPEQKGILKKQQQERRGYCEACLSRYSSLQQHRLSSSHQLFLSGQDNFSSLDRAISEFCSLEQVVRNFSSLASLFAEAGPGPARGETPSLSPSPPPSLQMSPYTPSKVRDSARHTPQACISFRPDASFLSYTPADPHRPLSPPNPYQLCPSFVTDPEVLSTPRVLKPRLGYLSAVSAPNTEAARRSYTIPIDSPKLGNSPEITLLIPPSSPDVSSMEWCESLTQTCPTPTLLSPTLQAPILHSPTLHSPILHSPMLQAPMTPQEQSAISQTPHSAEGLPVSQDSRFRSPSKQSRRSRKWVGEAKTPPLPKDMDTRLFMLMNYPYRQSKVNAFKKLSKLV